MAYLFYVSKSQIYRYHPFTLYVILTLTRRTRQTLTQTRQTLQTLYPNPHLSNQISYISSFMYRVECDIRKNKQEFERKNSNNMVLSQQ